MADWYVSSAVYAAIAAWAPTTAYTVGQIVRPTAPAYNASYTYRCTTAGTSGASEPSWPTGNNSTVTNGGAVFTNVSGQSTYNWAAPFGTLFTLQGVNARTANGDRIFVSSDHSETWSAFTNITFGTSGAYGLIQIISVNRAGSVPPVEADIQSGARVTNTNNTLTLDGFCELYYSGITIDTGTAGLRFDGANYAVKNLYFKNCKFVAAYLSWLQGGKVFLDNTPIQATGTGFGIGGGSGERCDLTWINTPNAIQGAIIPNNLFSFSYSGTSTYVTIRGVDLSALTTKLLVGGSNWVAKVLLDSCRIAPGLVRYQGDTTYGFNGEVELVNCYDGTNVINERWTDVGNVSTDRATYMTSGALDDLGPYSLKIVETLTVSDFLVSTIDCFTFDVENTTIGAAKTAVVEIASAASLTNKDVQLLLEYMGGGFTTWSPTDLITVALTNGNLTATAIGAGGGGVRNPAVLAAGNKYYWEETINIGSANSGIGIALSTAAFGTGIAFQAGTAGIVASGGGLYVNAAYQGVGLGSPGANQVVAIAVDRVANLMWTRYLPSGNWNGSGTANPATGVGGFSISSITTGLLMPAFLAFANTENSTANFGATPFLGVVPAGFAAPRTTTDPTANFISSLSSPLAVGAALPASVSPWTGSPANRQQLQVPFTPQRAGRVRGLVRLGKASTTIWVNPQITIV